MKRYSEEEKEIIKNNFETMTPYELVELLPGRTLAGIVHYIYTKNLRGKNSTTPKKNALTEGQIAFIKANYKTMNITGIRQAIKVSWDAVSLYMLENKLERCVQYRSLSPRKLKPMESEPVKIKYQRPPAVYSNKNHLQAYL